jgi:hypothetical protein
MPAPYATLAPHPVHASAPRHASPRVRVGRDGHGDNRTWLEGDIRRELPGPRGMVCALLCSYRWVYAKESFCSTNGYIQVPYTYVHRKLESLQELPDVFHMRHLSHPVLVKGYHTLECFVMYVLPALAFGARDVPANADMGTALLRAVGNGVGWCMFAIDVRNTYGLPFQVAFEQHQVGEGALSSIPYSA